MISFVNVSKKYTKEYYALSNINLECKKGDVLALLGVKDSGKTCILRILAGLEKQDSGEVYVRNIPINKLDYAVDVSMGYIPYKSSFFDKKSVYDNLKYVLDIRKTEKNALEETINNAIIEFRLENIAREKVYKLSLYQKYLVSIARLSMRKLDIVLIDNIFEELSQTETKEILRLIKKHFVKPTSIVIIATSSEEIAKSISTKIAYLKYGTIEKIV